MDRYEQILGNLEGLDQRLEQAGFADWLSAQRRIEVEGKSYVLVGGDRLASEAEAAIRFALDHGLVSPDEIRSADGRQSLASDLSSVDVDASRGDE